MPSVDNRVVQMRFDNKDFEEDIGTSIRSLDRLKSSLKLKDATDGFDEIGRAADRVSQKLTAFGTIGDQILRNIGNEIYSLKNKFVDLAKSMSTDQMKAGWDKYAEKTSAVQTIMSATADQFENEAEQMEYVNEQLDKLNWFTDETSYRLTDMTNNIGKFTNQGQKLDVAVRAMQGIATWAGLSGANVNEASRAMYNLSQAMGVGAVTLIDWKSISNANMATKEFKQTAIDTAVDLGTLKKQADGTYKSIKGTTVTIQNFDQTLSDRWFSSDVLTATLEKFGGFSEVLSDKIQELWENGSLVTTSEYLKYITAYNEGNLDLEETAKKTKQTVEELEADLKKLGSAEYELGRRAFIAAQQAKTFQEAIDATKDAVSSKWLRTFELVFGEYDNARKLWTNVANELWNIFAQGLEIRNGELEKWVTRGGYQILWRAISDLWTTLKKIGSRSWDIWHALFPELTVNKLMQATYKISTFAYNFKKQLLSLVFTSEELEKKGLSAQDWVKDLTKIMDGFRSAISLVLHILTELGKWIGIPALNTLFDAFKWGLSVISPFSEKFSEFVNKVKSSKIINKAFTNISTWFSNLKENLKKQENFKKFLENWQKFKDWLSDLKTSALEKISTFIENLGNMELQMPQIEAVGDFLNKIFGLINRLIDISTKIPEAWDAIKSFFTGLDFSNIQSLASSASSFISSFFTSLFNNEELKNAGGEWLQSFIDGIRDETGKIDKSKLLRSLINLVETGILVKLGWSISKFFDGVSSIPSATVKVMEQVGKTLGSFSKVLNAAAFLEIAVGVVALAGAMLLLSKIPEEKLFDVAIAISLVLSIVGLVANAITGTLKTDEKGNKLSLKNLLTIKRINVKFSTLGPALIGFGVALASVVYALKTLSKIDIPARDEALKYIGYISAGIAIIILLLGITAAFSKHSSTEVGEGQAKQMNQVGLRIISIGIALIAIAGALLLVIRGVSNLVTLFKENEYDPDVVTMSIIAIVLILGALGTLGALVSNGQGNIRSVLAIGVTFAGLYFILKPLKDFIAGLGTLDKIEWSKILAIFGGLSLFIIVLGGVLSLMLKMSKDSGMASAGLTAAMFAGLYFILKPLAAFIINISLLKDVDWTVIASIFGGFAIFLIAFGGAIALLASASKNAKANGNMVAMMALVAASIAALFGVFYALKDADTKNIIIIAAALAGLILLLGTIGALAGKFEFIGKGLLFITGSIALFGASIALAGAGALLFANALELLSKSTTDFKTAGKNLGEGISGFIEGLNGAEDKIIAFIVKLALVIMGIIAAKTSNIATNTGLLIDKIFNVLIGSITAKRVMVVSAIILFLFTIIEALGYQIDPIIDAVVILFIKIINGISKSIIKNAAYIWKAIANVIAAIALLLAKGYALLLTLLSKLMPEHDALGQWLRKQAVEVNKRVDGAIESVTNNITKQQDELSKALQLDFSTFKKDGYDDITVTPPDIVVPTPKVIDENGNIPVGLSIDENGHFVYQMPEVDFGAPKVDNSQNKWIDKETADYAELQQAVILDLRMEHAKKTGEIDYAPTQKEIDDRIAWLTEYFYSTAQTEFYKKTGNRGIIGSTELNNFIFGNYSDIAEAMTANGVYITDGLVSGIIHSMKDLSPGTTMGEDLTNQFTGYTEIKSPSKLFARLGLFIVQGLANGISQNSFLASDATSNMTNDIIDAFSSVVSDISDAINGDFNLDPTIRPVLDLSEIQNGGARISSIIGANRFAFAPDMGFSLDRARSVTAATANLNVGQTNLSEAMMLMQADIAAMKADNATIIGVLDRYMPSIPEIAHMQMVTDRGALVGELAPIMDKELGSIASRGRRGRF